MSYFTEFDKKDYKIPDECPMCHNGIEPKFVRGYEFNNKNSIYHQYRLVFQCPKEECLEIFIAYYAKSPVDVFTSSVDYVGSAPYSFKKEIFEEVILKISPLFVQIYNQAKEAETRKLDQICGLGYRKAFEFLIKDYLILKFPEKEEEIKTNHRFAALIQSYVEDERVKKLAERASWLGNDHAHYTKKWANKDITDLKKLIKTSIYWISAEMEFEYYINEM